MPVLFIEKKEYFILIGLMLLDAAHSFYNILIGSCITHTDAFGGTE